jgi:hypothetical protein
MLGKDSPVSDDCGVTGELKATGAIGAKASLVSDDCGATGELKATGAIGDKSWPKSEDCGATGELTGVLNDSLSMLSSEYEGAFMSVISDALN